MTQEFTDDDEGKPVVNDDDETVGLVVDVEDGVAYVDPDPDIAESMLSRLGWGDHDEELYRLEADHVDSVTDDEVRLHEGL